MSLPRHFYKAQPLRTLVCISADTSADLLAIEREAEGLMDVLRTPVQSDRARIATTAHSTQTLLCWHMGRRLASEHLQGGMAAYGEQNLVTMSRELTADHFRSFNDAEVVRMTDGREVGLAGGQA